MPVGAVALALAACGGSTTLDAKTVAECIQQHGGTALVAPNPETDAKGIPGRVKDAVEFSIAGQKATELEVGAVLVERTDADANRAVKALRHLDPTEVRIPGVDLSMLPAINAIKTGQAERYGKLLVLWTHGRKERSAKVSTTVRACV